MDIKKGDRVLVISGDDRGSEGEVQRGPGEVGKGRGRRTAGGRPRSQTAGINLVKKHQRRTGNASPSSYHRARATSSVECCVGLSEVHKPTAQVTRFTPMAVARGLEVGGEVIDAQIEDL
jgi:ribosomal protein L24